MASTGTIILTSTMPGKNDRYRQRLARNKAKGERRLAIQDLKVVWFDPLVNHAPPPKPDGS